MKIKSIKIKNFRVYNSEQTFDFYNKGKVADFIVIYAPNGFGKTSFIDAVEWSFTDRIERINNNSNMKALLDNEKRVFKENDSNLCVLRNINNPQETAHIKIISDKDEVFEVESKEFKGTKKCDYIIDSKTNVNRKIIKQDIKFKDIDEKSFKVNNLITSDMINSFLQIDKPTERFNILHKFWDKDDEYDFYKKILDIIKLLRDKKKLLETESKNKEKEIKKYKGCDDKLNMLNNLISRFNLYVGNEEINLIQKNEINKYPIEQFNELKINIQKNRTEIEEILLKLQYLLDENENYNSTKQLIILMMKNRDKLKELLNNFNNVDSINKLIDQNTQKINEINNKCKNYNYIFMNADYYLSIIIKNNKLNQEIDKCNAQIKDKMNKRRSYLNDFKISEKEYENSKNNYEKTIYEYNFRRDRHKEYSDNIKKKNYIKKINRVFNVAETKYTDLKKIFKERMDVLHKIKKNLDKKNIVYKLDKYHFNEQISKLIDESNSLINEYNHNKDVISGIVNHDDNLKEKKQQINKFLEISFSFIDENITNTCPLCNSEFKNYKQLKDSILLTLNCDSIDKEFEKIKSKSDQLIARNNEIKNNLEELFKNVIYLENKYSISFELESQKLESLNKKQKLVSEKFAKILKHQREICDYAGEAEVVDWVKDIETIMDNCNKSYLGQQFNNYNKMMKCKNYIRRIEEDVDKILLKIQENKECISCNNNTDILDIENVLKILNISLKDIDDKEYVEDYLLKMTKDKEVITKEIEECISKLSKYRLLVFSCKKENIEESLRKIAGTIKEEEDYVNKYRKNYKILVKDEEIINMLLIEEQVNSFRLKKNTNEQKFTLLNLILNDIDAIRDTKREVELEEELKKLHDRGDRITTKINEIDVLRNECEKYLNKKITGAFNLNTINSIYQMIDPHPDLQNIKFIPEFEGSSTKIHIHAFNSKKELAPVLYFSSAQISILALSIFFAQVLKNTSKLNTIFLDDPIQHLDSINTLAFIDLMRIMITQDNINKQIILTTNNNEFYELLKLKLNPKYYNSKFIALESYGEIKE